VFKKRRGIEDTVLGETRIALRSIGVNCLEAIMIDVGVQWMFFEMEWVLWCWL
jgi:hypothetical protein